MSLVHDVHMNIHASVHTRMHIHASSHIHDCEHTSYFCTQTKQTKMPALPFHVQIFTTHAWICMSWPNARLCITSQEWLCAFSSLVETHNNYTNAKHIRPKLVTYTGMAHFACNYMCTRVYCDTQISPYPQGLGFDGGSQWKTREIKDFRVKTRGQLVPSATHTHKQNVYLSGVVRAIWDAALKNQRGQIWFLFMCAHEQGVCL